MFERQRGPGGVATVHTLLRTPGGVPGEGTELLGGSHQCGLLEQSARDQGLSSRHFYLTVLEAGSLG